MKGTTANLAGAKLAAAIVAIICACAVAFAVYQAHQALIASQTPDRGQSASQQQPSGQGAAVSSLTDDGMPYEPGFLLATLADGVTSDELSASISADPHMSGIEVASVEGVRAKLSYPSSLSIDQAIALAVSNESIAAAQPNHYLYPQAAGASSSGDAPSLVSGLTLAIQAAINDPYYAQQWALSSINAPSAWDAIGTANASAPSGSVTIAVIDAGFRIAHEDLSANLAAAYNVVSGALTIEANNTSAASLRHGTHVAGIVAAQSNNGKGVAGATNNNCRVLPVRVEDASGDITTESVAKAFDYLVANQARYNIRVANVSLGIPVDTPVSVSSDPMLYAAIEKARVAGIVTVAASCNETGSYTPPFYSLPSDFDNVVSVINLEPAPSLYTDSVRRGSGSNYNKGQQKAKDISAPGESIYSLYGSSDNAYGRLGGTSMAAPMAAAVLGLMFTANPALSSDEAESKLFSTAHDISGPGWDAETGYGEVDAATAVSPSRPYLSGLPQMLMNTATQFSVKVAGVEQSAADWSWSTSDPAIATVSNGQVFGASEGQAVITATRNGLSAVQTVTVKKPYDVSEFDIVIDDQTYSGSECKPTPSVSNTTTKLELGTNFSVTYRNNVNVGLATAVISGIEPYTGTVEKRFAINKAPISKANIKLSGTTIAYTGKKVAPTVTVSDIGANKTTALKKGTDYSLTNAGVKIGKGTVTVRATSSCANYYGTATLSYKVKVKSTPVYQLYNRATRQWFYTAIKSEQKTMKSHGWTYKGVAWKSPTHSNHPVYRLSKKGQYSYTMTKSKRKSLVSKGWKYEKVAFYSDDYKTRAIYLHANPTRYTKSKSSTKSFYAL